MNAEQNVEVLPDKQPAAVQLEGLRDGQVIEEVAEALRELAGLVLLHQKKGKMTLTLHVDPLPGGQVVVADEVTITPPKCALPQTIRFVDRVGNLVTHNPDAPDLMSRLRELEGGAK